jgi:hypothetical protein
LEDPITLNSAEDRSGVGAAAVVAWAFERVKDNITRVREAKGIA